MDSSSNISSANQAYYNKIQSNNKIKDIQNANTNPIEQEKVKDGDKKSINVLKWAGLIALGSVLLGGTIYTAQKGKTVKLNDISFSKGIASLKDSGEKFSGTISDTTKGGNKIKMIYKDGVLQKSIKSGENGCTKLYNYNDKGRISTLIRNGETRNVEEKYQKGLEKLRNLKLTEEEAEKIKEEVLKDTESILKSNGIKIEDRIKEFIQNNTQEEDNLKT